MDAYRAAQLIKKIEELEERIRVLELPRIDPGTYSTTTDFPYNWNYATVTHT